MKLTTISNSARVLDMAEFSILFSYETPVAVHIIGSHFLITEVYHSRTTSKHIGLFAPKDAVREIVPQERIDNVIYECL